MRKTYAISVALVALFLVYVMPVVAAYPYTPYDEEVENALCYLARAQDKTTGAIGSYYFESGWAVMAISAAGEAGKDKFEECGGDFSKLMSYIKNNLSLIHI